jgi:DNA-binding NtrC family response regulator
MQIREGENQLLKNHKPKILVVDDEKLIRWSLGEALRSWGFDPLQHSSARSMNQKLM